MFKVVTRCALVVALVLSPLAARAEPIKLKLALFTSDRSLLYRGAVKPFVDAVNAEAHGLMEIDVQFSGALAKDPGQQALLVADGTADIAFVALGYTPQRFNDDAVIELPGLFSDSREASLVFSHLVAANALAGYDAFYVIGVFASSPETIHTRPPIASLADLKGKRIRVNNQIQAGALANLGMSPVSLPINQTADAIIGGKIDGAALPPAMLVEFGVGRSATHHYLLSSSVAPLALLMNRTKFDRLPKDCQHAIRKYSGEWEAARFADSYDAADKQSMERLANDPRRTVVVPSKADLRTAQATFKTVIAEWAARSSHNRELLTRVEGEIAKLRATR